MARPRKSDALSVAERQRRHVELHDLRHLRAPRSVMDRVDEIAGDRSLSRAEVLVMLLDEWDARRAASQPAPPPRGQRWRKKVGSPEGPAKPSGGDQPDLFAVFKGGGTREAIAARSARSRMASGIALPGRVVLERK
jgi:hypothetical protein